jgi:hypothetical protein
MFKKILQSLSRSQTAKTETAKQVPAKNPAPAAHQARGVLNQIAQPAATPSKSQTPEELCQITPKMSKDQIKAQLKLLYRRYNRSASSLDSKIRSEADQMLTAIVTVREKNFGEI